MERTSTPMDPSPSYHGDANPADAPRAADSKRDALASGIKSAAAALHSRADAMPGGDRVAGVAHSAADAMETAADYVREQDLRAMLSDMRRTVTRHPGAALLTAVAVGFLVARSISRD